MERLDKLISAQANLTRSEAGRAVRCGRVTVDGKVCRQGAEKLDPAAHVIAIDGRELGYAKFVYWMLNKPAGFVTATEDPVEKTVMELLPDEMKHLDLKPVGRLDKATEGLLLFTNDGDFANSLMHPKHEVKKTYDTWVTGYVPGAEVRLSRPIELDGYTIRPPRVKILKAEGKKALFQITIHEGRNRQVRRMCEAAGMTVTRLRRVSQGNLKLGDLQTGCWRYLTKEEMAGLL